MEQDGRRIRELREERGISVDDFAKRIKVHAQSLRRYEAGRRTPDPDKLLAIASALEVPLREIVRAGTPLLKALTRDGNGGQAA